MNLTLAGAIAGWLSAGLALAGTAQAVAGPLLVRRFLSRAHAPAAREPAFLPPVTLLKPLHGDEPLLEQALASFCTQDYPTLQIVFGVQDRADPAIAVVARLRARFPEVDVTLVVDPTRHGPNRKVDNLINMLPHCRHQTLIISDADIHAAPDLVRDVVAPFADPAIGLVTTLYTGRSASNLVCRQLGAAQINQMFLPGALIGRALGRRDCLGAVMALSADTLREVGGFRALSPHLADDAVLGRKVKQLGLQVALARTVPATSVVENSFSELFHHELRWGRTVRSQAPIGYPMSILQAPIVWAALASACFHFSTLSVALFAAIWAVRVLAGRDLERHLDLPPAASAPFWLAPLRDLLSLSIIVASHAGGRVAWRGQTLHVSPQKNLRLVHVQTEQRPIERPAWRSAS